MHSHTHKHTQTCTHALTHRTIPYALSTTIKPEDYKKNLSTSFTCWLIGEFCSAFLTTFLDLKTFKTDKLFPITLNPKIGCSRRPITFHYATPQQDREVQSVCKAYRLHNGHTFAGSCSKWDTLCVCFEQLLASCCPLWVRLLGSHANGSRLGNLSPLLTGECAVRVECCHPSYSRGTRRNPCLHRHIHHGRTDETSISCRVELSEDKQQNPTLISQPQQTTYWIKRFSTFSLQDQHRNQPRLLVRCFSR